VTAVDLADASAYRHRQGELLLELLSEEIPARMQRKGLEDLKKQLGDFLGNGGLLPDDIRGYVTPRRLTVIATGIAAKQSDFHEERRGPRIGAPEPARAGFARSAGVSIEDLVERGGYYYAEIVRVGRPAIEILPKLIVEAIEETTWPKSMRFPAAPLHWVRPINSILCLFDGEIVPLSLGQVPVGRTTRGHRVLAPEPIEVAGAEDYLERLRRAYVVLDRAERIAAIDGGLKQRAAAEGLSVKPDAGLLEEVTGLVEYPVVLAGSIDPDFVKPVTEGGLPPEVLATAMRTHQKYFSCVTADGSPAPRFLFVANNLAPDGGAAISAGNERVLRARLADARFFWDQDRKVRLEARVSALADRVFHAKLGSMLDKTERVERLSQFLAAHLGAAQAAGHVEARKTAAVGMDSRLRGNDGEELVWLARRAARLAKADLSTGMVGEFPELQGVIGRYYALHDGEDPRVADAIADHYKPLGPSDTCPTRPVSVIVALADKLDTLAAFFAIGEKPTGSRDPFALRRAALGIIRIVFENGLRLPLLPVFVMAGSAFASNGSGTPDELLVFVVDRLKVHLREQGFRHDLIAAAFRPQGKVDDDIARIVARAEALRAFLDAEYGVDLLIAYRRASNIVAIEEKNDGRFYDGEVDPLLLQTPEEQTVFEMLNHFRDDATSLIARDVFEQAFHDLMRLRHPVDAFFDKVTVNTADRALRDNRLKLMARIRDIMNEAADFSMIEG